jgi:hypothetical protein
MPINTIVIQNHRLSINTTIFPSDKRESIALQKNKGFFASIAACFAKCFGLAVEETVNGTKYLFNKKSLKRWLGNYDVTFEKGHLQACIEKAIVNRYSKPDPSMEEEQPSLKPKNGPTTTVGENATKTTAENNEPKTPTEDVVNRAEDLPAAPPFSPTVIFIEEEFIDPEEEEVKAPEPTPKLTLDSGVYNADQEVAKTAFQAIPPSSISEEGVFSFLDENEAHIAYLSDEQIKALNIDSLDSKNQLLEEKVVDLFHRIFERSTHSQHYVEQLTEQQIKIALKKYPDGTWKQHLKTEGTT